MAHNLEDDLYQYDDLIKWHTYEDIIELNSYPKPIREQKMTSTNSFATENLYEELKHTTRTTISNTDVIIRKNLQVCQKVKEDPPKMERQPNTIFPYKSIAFKEYILKRKLCFLLVTFALLTFALLITLICVATEYARLRPISIPGMLINRFGSTLGDLNQYGDPRNYTCPYPLPGSDEVVRNRQELVEHLRRKHRNQLEETCYSERDLVVFETHNAWYATFYLCHGELFLRWVRRSRNGTFEFQAQLYGPDTEVKKYKYEVTVVNVRNESKSITREGFFTTYEFPKNETVVTIVAPGIIAMKPDSYNGIYKYRTRIIRTIDIK